MRIFYSRSAFVTFSEFTKPFIILIITFVIWKLKVTREIYTVCPLPFSRKKKKEKRLKTTIKLQF